MILRIEVEMLAVPEAAAGQEDRQVRRGMIAGVA